MNVWHGILEALDSLSSNKVRSALTILGIVIGVGAVIAMLAIGTGAEQAITGSISGIGTNLLFVFQGSDNEEVRNPKPLTLEDAEAIADPFSAPSVIGVAPMLQGGVEVCFAGECSGSVGLGVTPDYQPVRNVELAEGEFISELAETLFGRSEGLLGETVRVEGQPFRIIGIKTRLGGSGFQNPDDEILVPLSTAQTNSFTLRKHKF